ncbi:MAG: glycosyltransferase [Isosphaeraceae bacterium]
MNKPAHDALASIVMPCWNQLDYTRSCLPALVRHTRPPWELIVIDIGSTDGTGIYLAGVQDVAPMWVTVVSNAQNLGFPAAINQGVKAARGDCLVLLHNDAVVTDGWLNQLIALAEMDSDGTTKHTKDSKGKGKKKEGAQRGFVWAWLGRCRTMPRRRNSWRTCRIPTWKRCTRSRDDGARIIGGSGSRRASYPGSACS